MENINYVIYSHTDYLDILKIHLDYSKFFNKTLIINKTRDISDIIHEFDKVIYYDDTKPYAERLYTSLKEIDSEIILFTHDMDIPISYDNNFIIKLQKQMVEENIHRIDLQQDVNASKNESIRNDLSNVRIDELTLIKNNNINNYIYNVNPSLWNRRSFIEILSNYKNETYRSIELSNIQSTCLNYNIFKCHHNGSLKLGWFFVTPVYKYLHMTHSGKFLPIQNNMNGLDQDTQNIYQTIISKFNLLGGNREFSSSLF